MASILLRRRPSLSRYISQISPKVLAQYASIFGIDTHLEGECGNVRKRCMRGQPSRKIHSTPIAFKRKTHVSNNNVDDLLGNAEEAENEEDDDQPEDPYKFQRLLYGIPGVGQCVFLVQPHLTSASRKRPYINVKFQLDESVALVETLTNWKVVDKTIVKIKNIEANTVFSSGRLESLVDRVHNNPQITAVFISLDMLSGSQQAELEKLFELKVFDRYSVVLNIFQEHCKSKVAQLQITLAEIPYYRSRLNWLSEGGRENHPGGVNYIGGPGETYLETQRRLLCEREVKLNKAIRRLQNQRRLLRSAREKRNLPVVAVVGYTNAGKTALIKALTGDKDAQPKDQLFATLDVTAHGGILPCCLRVVYIDTVGFISDIPTGLIASFGATLEDAIQADLIIHVRDVSHPDVIAQKECVLQTLKDLHVPSIIMDNIVEIGNKVDLINEYAIPELLFEDGEILPVSATTGYGLLELKQVIEKKLLSTTESETKKFRVPNGGEEYRWLYSETAVNHVEADLDANFLLITTIVTRSSYGRFQHKFGDLEVLNS